MNAERIAHAGIALTLGVLTFTACSPAEPTLQDAGQACIRYAIDAWDAEFEIANEACHDIYERLGEEAFIERWIG